MTYICGNTPSVSCLPRIRCSDLRHVQPVLSVGDATAYVEDAVGDPPAATMLFVLGAAQVHSPFRKKHPTLLVGLAVAARFAVV